MLDFLYILNFVDFDFFKNGKINLKKIVYFKYMMLCVILDRVFC